MRIARWVSNATDARSDFVLQISFALQQWLRERVPILRNTYIVLLLLLSIYLAVRSTENVDLCLQLGLEFDNKLWAGKDLELAG